MKTKRFVWWYHGCEDEFLILIQRQVTEQVRGIEDRGYVCEIKLDNIVCLEWRQLINWNLIDLKCMGTCGNRQTVLPAKHVSTKATYNNVVID